MNIYIHEFKARIKSVLIWSFSIIAMIVVFMSMFQSFASTSISITELMESFPEELLMAFGMTDTDWTTVLGFYGLIFTFVQICLAIQAANYGFSLVSIEETEWTADFLISKPVSRSKIMTAKLLAAITSLIITQAVVWAGSFLFIEVFRGEKAYQPEVLVSLLLSLTVFQLFFLTAGMVISMMVKRIRSVTPYSMGLVFGLYILNAFGSMIGDQSLEIISPFKHFSPNYIIKHSQWEMPLALVSVAVIVISLVGSYLLYQRRNLLSAV